MCCCLYPRVLLHARHAEWYTSVLMTEQTDETRDYAIGLAGGQFEAAGRTNHAGRAKTKIKRSRAVCVRGHCGDRVQIHII